MTVQNLDAACATLGVKLGSSGNKDTENSITKALAVLEEQGIYAMFLYLVAREDGKFVRDLIAFMEEWCGLQGGKQRYESWTKAKKKRDEVEKSAKSPQDRHRKETARRDEKASREAFFQTLCGYADNVDKLLFARDLLHRALVYARYHAKAAQIGGDGT
jgi:hypothetical protein